VILLELSLVNVKSEFIGFGEIIFEEILFVLFILLSKFKFFISRGLFARDKFSSPPHKFFYDK
jgi:hypothetical protein